MNERQILSWFLQAGITETIGETPVNRYSRHTPPPTMVDLSPTRPTPALPTQRSIPTDDILLTRARQAADAATTLTELYAARHDFDSCPIRKTAAHTVNGRGAAHPTVLCLIESPDTPDDRSGTLMSGPAGDLLTKMLAAIGLNLQTNTYLSALIPWRAPGNRQPTETEAALCRPFWEKEITLLAPRFILLFGTGPAKALLQIDSLPRARTTTHTYRDIPTFVTIHPATLLKLPAQKKQAWEDLQKFKKVLDTLSE